MLTLLVTLLLYGDSRADSQRFEQQHPFEVFKATQFAQYRLNFSCPTPHFFLSVHGLLRQGYNTFFPNGFSIAACELPTFTAFYHGWLNDEPPRSPEWLSSTPYVQNALRNDKGQGISMLPSHLLSS